MLSGGWQSTATSNVTRGWFESSEAGAVITYRDGGVVYGPGREASVEGPAYDGSIYGPGYEGTVRL